MRAIRSAIRPSIRSSFGIDIVDELQALINSLFSASEQGAFYIPRPVVNGLQSLFQDAAGTTPVTADGDPVGKMLDQSGNGNHASQSTSAARPTYNDFAIGGDGVDDSMVSADFGNPAGVTMICAIKIAAGQSTFAVLFGLQDSTESRDNMIARVAADGSIDIIFTLSNGSKILGNIGNLGTEYIIFTLSFNNGVAKAYVNGVSVFSETGVSGALGGESNTLLLFSDINGTRQSEVDIKGFALASYHLDDEKRTATESYFASLAGVTL